MNHLVFSGETKKLVGYYDVKTRKFTPATGREKKITIEWKYNNKSVDNIDKRV